ncbi:U-box protein [Rhizoctonia solani AG-3 Rhs1AP]|uniref:U-box protein n=2 Tax=Rhizoctonia solani AG-3 TaxID=1086053 RepID=A0A074SUL6_9AGAM|nr:U-box protein [Rhizoctonia solani AG-3 Rhs1AP]KEP53602.1 U-box protein [Rhizoctonia solani 123E]
MVTTTYTPSPPSTELQDAPPAYDSMTQPGDLDIRLVAQPSTRELLVSLVPPTEPKPAGEKKTGRAPVDLCLVIDVSGSMDTEAPVPGKQDKNETTGLSVLDVVKHATRTIIESMGDDDRIAVVTFSDSAEIVAPLTLMNKANRTKVWSTIEGLRTRGMTNLWDGLKTGMNVVTGNTPSQAPVSPVSSTPSWTPPPAVQLSASSDRSSWLRALGLDKNIQLSPQPSQEPKTEPESRIKAPGVDDTLSTPSAPKDQRLSAVFILTDGQPNIDPPRGHIPMLKSYLDALPSDAPNFTISTFGFGYNLDSRLLDEIANVGQGMYGFIPDSGMVGTVFVHALANLLSTWATGCVLDIEVVTKDPNADAKVKVLGAFPVTYSSWGANIRLGDLQYGQSRDVVILLPSGCFGSAAIHTVNISAKYSPHTHSDREFPSLTTESLQLNHEVGNSVILQHHAYRLSFICAISKIFLGLKKTSTTCPVTKSEFEQSISNYLNNSTLKRYEPSQALTTDITSQVILGLEPEHWNRWGMHYLPSLARSHQRQQCLNFKDEGLQVYGRDSTIFISTRDRIDQTFDSLPPPKPSLKDRAVYRPGSNSAATYSPVATMAMYRSCSAPCFAGWCYVDTENGRTRVSDLRRGTLVRTPNGASRVAAVLKTICSGRIMDLCTVGQLAITPWHPMHHNGSWVFPAQICEPKLLPCDYVYSILLEPSLDSESHSVRIEGMWCVTLGHGCIDPVRAHPFLGDYARVVESLSQLEGYYDEDGVIFCAGVARDNFTNMVCGFRHLKTNKLSGPLNLCVPHRVVCKV